ncbi:mucin TcMUCII [Trypanosoma cruzi]|nr:mucin TcMUCII [Trypanosoma cruzi]
MSNFAEYYGLVEEERGDGGGTGGSSRCVSPLREMETRGAETTSLLPTTIRRFVRAMEGATDMPVACTLRVTDGPRLVDERLSTIMPGERCTSGGSETTGLRPIDDVGSDAVLQWRFLLSRSVFMSGLFASLFLPWRSWRHAVRVWRRWSHPRFVLEALLWVVSVKSYFSCWESCGCA